MWGYSNTQRCLASHIPSLVLCLKHQHLFCHYCIIRSLCVLYGIFLGPVCGLGQYLCSNLLKEGKYLIWLVIIYFHHLNLGILHLFLLILTVWWSHETQCRYERLSFLCSAAKIILFLVFTWLVRIGWKLMLWFNSWLAVYYCQGLAHWSWISLKSFDANISPVLWWRIKLAVFDQTLIQYHVWRGNSWYFVQFYFTSH